MRRGLLQDLANTPTQIACGWRLYGDLQALAGLDGQSVGIDLLSGKVTTGGHEAGPLHVAVFASEWMQERIVKDNVPSGLIQSAIVTLSPRVTDQQFIIGCETIVETQTGVYRSRDTATWHPSDVQGQG